MAAKLNKNQAGLALGTISAIFHALWVIAVGIGLGQKLADWFHSVHFLGDSHTVASFSIGTAVIGIIEAFIFGYIAGWLFVLIWNWFGKKLK